MVVGSVQLNTVERVQLSPEGVPPISIQLRAKAWVEKAHKKITTRIFRPNMSRAVNSLLSDLHIIFSLRRLTHQLKE
jgi:hypothetical protein